MRHNGEILKIAAANVPTNLPLPSIYGDTDLDGDVDQTDLNNFLAGWNQTAPSGPQSWMKGDFNLNGITDLPDVYFMHEALVNAGLGGFSPFGGQLPEPTSGVLLAWCLQLV